ncbi:hypothetical protein DPMN_137634 [Dreissena polymorpha]|uniref:Uncharacterized protein n=1 Tax=Dreissena polymorpha TaxID=45954 RepID=A0A9D4G2B3_DREPO|nr:hypothetical protein DPMN_137634 [Dreissena polymorpha]
MPPTPSAAWKYFTTSSDKKSPIQVTFKHSAGHYDASPVTIFICDPPPPAPSNPNSASGASSASATSGGIDNFMFWLIPALLLLALMAGLAVYLIRRCIQGGRCGSCYQSRTVKTIRPLQDSARGQTRVITAREADERQAVYRKPPPLQHQRLCHLHQRHRQIKGQSLRASFLSSMSSRLQTSSRFSVQMLMLAFHERYLVQPGYPVRLNISASSLFASISLVKPG